MGWANDPLALSLPLKLSSPFMDIRTLADGIHPKNALNFTFFTSVFKILEKAFDQLVWYIM